MGHLAAEAHLVYGCCGITAADDGRSVRICQSLGNCLGAGCKNRVLEDAHGAVPNDGLCFFHSVGIEGNGLGPNVSAFAVCRNLVCIYNNSRNVCLVDGIRELVDGDDIDRKKKLLAVLLCLLHHLLAVVHLRLVEEGLADLIALGLEEGVSHAAANDQGIALLQKIINDIQLVSNLCTAEDGNERTNRVLNRIAQEVDLLLHEVADYVRTVDELSNADIGAVSPVSGTESVVYEDIGQRSQVPGEGFAVFGLLRTETGILKKDDVAVLHSINCCAGIWTYDLRVGSKLDGLAEELGKPLSNRGKGLGLLVLFRLYLTEMGAENDLAAIGNKLLDGGKGSYETVLIRNFPVHNRYVEVAAAEDSLALHVDVIDSLFVQTHSNSPLHPGGCRKPSDTKRPGPQGPGLH